MARSTGSEDLCIDQLGEAKLTFPVEFGSFSIVVSISVFDLPFDVDPMVVVFGIAAGTPSR